MLISFRLLSLAQELHSAFGNFGELQLICKYIFLTILYRRRTLPILEFVGYFFVTVLGCVSKAHRKLNIIDRGGNGDCSNISCLGCFWETQAGLNFFLRVLSKQQANKYSTK